MSNFKNKCDEAQRFLQKHLDFEPDIAVILGSGMGEGIENILTINRLPYFPIILFKR